MSPQSIPSSEIPKSKLTFTQVNSPSSQMTPRVIPRGPTSGLALVASADSTGTDEHFGMTIPELQFGDDFYDTVMRKLDCQPLGSLDKFDRDGKNDEVAVNQSVKSDALFPLIPYRSTSPKDQTTTRTNTLVSDKAKYAYEQGDQAPHSIQVNTKRRFKSVTEYVPTPYTETKFSYFGKSRGDETPGLMDGHTSKDGPLELGSKVSVLANPTRPSSAKRPMWLHRDRYSEEGSRSVASLVATSIRRRARSHSVGWVTSQVLSLKQRFQ
ncbi:hypothetical protein IWQ61_002340 [Dispira simplex]|nr:hypothetical protein IWQ61_002340 [Dispira simplex]